MPFLFTCVSAVLYVLVAPPGCAWCQSSVLCVLVAQVWCQYAQVRHENILLSKSSCVIYGSPGVVPLCPGEAFHSYYVYRILHLNLTCKAVDNST